MYISFLKHLGDFTLEVEVSSQLKKHFMLTKEFHILIEDSRNPHINSRAAPKQKGSLKRQQLLQLKDYNAGTCRESPTTKHFSVSQQTRNLFLTFAKNYACHQNPSQRKEPCVPAALC
jgi:hypothetical protein